jgi:hypothetical protein
MFTSAPPRFQMLLRIDNSALPSQDLRDQLQAPLNRVNNVVTVTIAEVRCETVELPIGLSGCFVPHWAHVFAAIECH